jgi:hypothetical protein
MSALRDTLAAVALFVLVPALAMADGYYPDSLRQLPHLNINLPADVGLVPLPSEVLSPYNNSLVQSAWRTELRKAQQVELHADATPEDAFDDRSVPLGLILMPLHDASGTQQSWFVSVAASHPDIVSVEVLVGRDLNGDGRPQREELLCRDSAQSLDSPHCLLDLRGKTDRSIWAFAHVTGTPQGGSALQYKVDVAVSTADFQLGEDKKTVFLQEREDFILSIFGDSHGGDVAGFQFRARADQDRLSPSHEMGGMLITGHDRALQGATIWPVRMDFGAFVRGGDFYALAARADRYDEVSIHLDPGETNQGIWIDNPGQDRMDVVLSDPLATLTIWKEAFPSSSIDSTPVAMPKPEGAKSFLVDQSTHPVGPVSACAAEDLPGCIHLKIDAGRWHFAVHNTRTDAPAVTRVAVRLSKASNPAARPTPGLHVPNGNYYVPQRSGDGLFLERVGDLQLVYWYTFDYLGDPAWYVASSLPNYESNVEGSINATFYEVNRFWGFPQAQAAGRIVLTEIEGSSDLMFSWNDLGEKGANRLVLAAASTCAQVGGVPRKLSGHWFAPDSPGWGMNMLGLGESTPSALYFYDARGFPRWLFASYTNEGSAYRTELFQSMHGSYPTWSYQKPVLAKVGLASLVFDADNSATFSASATLMNSAPPDSQFPLQGSFVVQGQHIVRATDTVGCGAQ